MLIFIQITHGTSNVRSHMCNKLRLMISEYGFVDTATSDGAKVQQNQDLYEYLTYKDPVTKKERRNFIYAVINLQVQ